MRLILLVGQDSSKLDLMGREGLEPPTLGSKNDRKAENSAYLLATVCTTLH